MQRLVAVLVIVLAGLSLLVSTEAFRSASPTSPALVPIVSTEQAALRVEAGTNNPVGMVSTVVGSLVLDLRKGGNPGPGFDTNSTYKLNKIIKVTNLSGLSRTVSVGVTGNAIGTVAVSGHVAGGAQTNPPWTVAANQSVEVNFTWTTGAAVGTSGMTITVTGN